MKLKLILFGVALPFLLSAQSFQTYINSYEWYRFENPESRKKIDRVYEDYYEGVTDSIYPKPDKTIVSIYDRKQRLKEKFTVINEKINNYQHFFYDIKGRISKVRYMQKAPYGSALKWEARYGYDSQGRRNSVSFYDEENYTLGWFEFLEFNEKGHPETINRYNEQNKLIEIKEAFFNYRAEEIEINISKPGKEARFVREDFITDRAVLEQLRLAYKVNKKGLLTYIRPKIKPNLQYEIVYDKYDNWIVKDEYQVDTKADGLSKKKFIKRISREVIYRD